MMLWVNLIMDTLGALALATEEPTMKVLDRKPYKRTASLISRPMMRNILVQATFQLAILFLILFGHKLFNVEPGERCSHLNIKKDIVPHWLSDSTKYYVDIATGLQTHPNGDEISCETLAMVCKDNLDQTCYEDDHRAPNGDKFSFRELDRFSDKCLDTCTQFTWVHGSMIFNAFVFCQVFNEYNAKSIHSDWDIFSTILSNHIFLFVTAITVGLQIMLIEAAGPFMKTSPLTLEQWGVTIGLAAITFPIGILMRFIPVSEDPSTFFDNDDEIKKASASMKNKKQALEIA